YESLGERRPRGFPRNLLAGIDAGVAVRAADRPQSIAAWQSILHGGSASDEATAVLAARAPSVAVPKDRKARVGIYVGMAVAVLALMAGGYFALAPKPSLQTTALQDMKVEDLEKALEARRKADAEAEDKRQADEALAKAQAERQRADEAAARTADAEAKQKAEADEQTKAAAEARAKADTEARKAAEIAEAGLRLGQADRQRIQLALNS